MPHNLNYRNLLRPKEWYLTFDEAAFKTSNPFQIVPIEYEGSELDRSVVWAFWYFDHEEGDAVTVRHYPTTREAEYEARCISEELEELADSIMAECALGDRYPEEFI